MRISSSLRIPASLAEVREEHFVPGLGHPLELVTGSRHAETLREVLNADGFGDAGDLVHGRERSPADPVATEAGRREDTGDHQQEEIPKSAHHRPNLIQRPS